MKTVQICKDVTATLSNEKFNQYVKAFNATREKKIFSRSENMDWADYDNYLDILCIQEDEAWEKFCS